MNPCAKAVEAKANINRVIRVILLVFIMILFLLYVRFLDVIAGLTRNLLNASDTFPFRGLRMFLRNDGKARGTRSQSRVTEGYQKTKGLSFSEEINTIHSCPERNLSVFLEDWLLKTVFTWAQVSVRLRWGRIKDCKLTTKCLSGEKTKLSVNWMRLS